jgi:hypothetical protein
MARSAWGVTVVVRVDELLPGVGSAVELDTVAVLVSVPEAGAMPVTVAVNVPALARSALVQVSVPVATAHPGVVVAGEARAPGNGSVIVGATAIDGPSLVTVNVYVTEPAAFTDTGAVFTMLTSACGVIVVVRVDELFPGVGSAVELDTVAVLDRAPEAGAMPVTVTVEVPALARSVSVQSSVPDAIAQPGVAVAADARVPGSGSVIVGATAIEGPVVVLVNV